LVSSLYSHTYQVSARQIGQQNIPDPLVIAKFFSPSGSATWYATEYLEADNICFGYVSGLSPGGDEWGYFSIDELEAIKCPPFDLAIERDLHFTETLFSQLKTNEL
jgi:hypothetical protein